MIAAAFRTAAAVLALIGALSLESAKAAPSDLNSVNVTIRILPYAQFSIPPASGFILRVRPLACPPLPALLPASLRHRWALQCYLLPGWQPWPPVVPARLPFAVEGNARVQVSVLPGSFLRTYGGRYLGRATRTGVEALGYHAIVHFPVATPIYHWVADWLGWDDWRQWNGWAGYGYLPIWSRIAHLPGTNGGGTPPLAADLSARGNRAYGVIYAVARRSWTASGTFATPGDYQGSVVITVTAE